MSATSLDFPIDFGDSGYNIELIIQKLKLGSDKFDFLANKNTVRKVTNELIGCGFTSKVFKILFEFNDGSKWSCIMKVPSGDMLKDSGLKDALPDDVCEQVHRKECKFFENVKHLPNMPIPDLYYTEEEIEDRRGCLLMQDLSDEAIVIHPYLYVGEELCVNLAKTVARFQATAQVISKEIFEAYGSIDSLFGILENMFKDSLPGSAVCEGVDEEKLGKFMFLVNADFIRFALSGIGEEYSASSPVHGDLHGYNILIYKNEQGSMSDRIAAFIDWQAFYQGNPLTDLSRFISTMADSSVRRGLGDQIVDIYYDTLTEEYQKRGKKVSFTRETCQILYEVTQIFHALYASIIPRFQRHLTAKINPDEANARISVVVLRANDMLEDALPLIDKFKLRDKYIT